MTGQVTRYVFINSRTGNIIGYLSLRADLSEMERNRCLELKRTNVAVSQRLLLSTIYWKLQETPAK